MVDTRSFRVHAGETIGVGLLLKILKDAELSKDDLKK